MAAIAMDKTADHLMISKGVNFNRDDLILSQMRFLKGSSNGIWKESWLVELEHEHLKGDKKWVLVLFIEKSELDGVLKRLGLCWE